MPQSRSNDPLRRAVRKLVLGLEKRERVRREKRRYNRQPLDVRVSLCTKAGEGRYQTLCEAWASDVSMGGISCLTEQPLDPECTIYVNFEEILGHACCIPINVHRCQALVGNIRQINAQFAFDTETETDPSEKGEAA